MIFPHDLNGLGPPAPAGGIGISSNLFSARGSRERGDEGKTLVGAVKNALIQVLKKELDRAPKMPYVRKCTRPPADLVRGCPVDRRSRKIIRNRREEALSCARFIDEARTHRALFERPEDTLSEQEKIERADLLDYYAVEPGESPLACVDAFIQEVTARAAALRRGLSEFIQVKPRLGRPDRFLSVRPVVSRRPALAVRRTPHQRQHRAAPARPASAAPPGSSDGPSGEDPDGDPEPASQLKNKPGTSRRQGARLAA